MYDFVNVNKDTNFAKQIHLIKIFKGAHFLFIITIIWKIAIFLVFSKQKQPFVYFGSDQAVKQYGKFEGIRIKISKRGYGIFRWIIHILTLQNITTFHIRKIKNLVFHDYYLRKCASKLKLIALELFHIPLIFILKLLYKFVNIFITTLIYFKLVYIPLILYSYSYILLFL